MRVISNAEANSICEGFVLTSQRFTFRLHMIDQHFHVVPRQPTFRGHRFDARHRLGRKLAVDHRFGNHLREGGADSPSRTGAYCGAFGNVAIAAAELVRTSLAMIATIAGKGRKCGPDVAPFPGAAYSAAGAGDGLMRAFQRRIRRLNSDASRPDELQPENVLISDDALHRVRNHPDANRWIFEEKRSRIDEQRFARSPAPADEDVSAAVQKQQRIRRSPGLQGNSSRKLPDRIMRLAVFAGLRHKIGVAELPVICDSLGSPQTNACSRTCSDWPRRSGMADDPRQAHRKKMRYGPAPTPRSSQQASQPTSAASLP